ncbi:FtsK/SpoIIIE domain-containing protein [Nocardiopsis sp. JB363]|uniref:FtsK/SpoIIIE domain-containing protein n=1 Tax=Nocardiopsis sp. JB363 TaxID=1434837 RepID=UPI00097AAD80|nr:FtsK/SpoIIIE domain-containing protein [Nocardiopsis sp. JB363]SIO86157.1 Cell division protein FtsK [Nocardiopsis sp. JB363]
MHETTSTPPRHLHPVPDDPADVPTGLVWQAEDQDSGPVAGRVMDAAEDDTSLTPLRADRAQITDRLRASLEAANTYALLAWNRRWEVAMDYVMDPALRQQMLDAAEDELDTKIADAEKAVRRSIKPEDTAKANKKLKRLQRREVSELEVDARVLRARTARLTGRCVVPAAVIVGPVLLAASGIWVGLLAWPTAWGWLALQGRAMARAEVTTTATETTPAPSKVEARARQLAEASAEATVGAAVAATVVGATDAENQILARLAKWKTLAARRGLEGTAPGDPTLAETGLSVVVTCSARITPGALMKKTGAVRSLLGVPTDTALDIVQGERGDQALVRIRTRTPERDMTWAPGKEGVGVDVTTGQVVDLQVYHRMLIAGASRSGKTVMMRVLMAKVVADPNAKLILIDAKRVEAARWKHVARTACTPGDISNLVVELRKEMDRRYEQISQTGRAWVPSPKNPRLVIVIDEGAEVIKQESKDTPILSDLQSLAAMGGEAEMHMWWCTQKPTMTGQGRGIDNAIAGQMTGARVSLRVSTPTEARTVLGEDANAAGWNPQELERAGLALIRDGERGPDPVAVWNLSDENLVLALPPQTPWGLPATEVSEPEDVSEEADEQGEDNDDWIGAQHAVMDALRTGPKTSAQLVEITGYSKSMVSNALGQHKAAGKVVKGPGHRAAWRAL